MKVLLIGGCGYIGTRLYDDLSGIYDITSVDTEFYGKTVDDNIKRDYARLSPKWISQFDVVILLAGRSSVNLCKNVTSTLTNNVVKFVRLLQSVRGKLIYASSSSVYCGLRDAHEEEFSYKPKNYYDLTKYEIDLYASLSDIETYGLRFGTVNGYSRNLRSDIMLNSMYISYTRNNFVKYNNPDITRPILAMSDLVSAVKRIIDSRQDKRGVYNIASFNDAVGSIAFKAGSILGCEAIKYPPSSAYDFSIDTTKFCDAFDFEFTGTVQSIIEDLRSKPINLCGKR